MIGKCECGESRTFVDILGGQIEYDEAGKEGRIHMATGTVCCIKCWKERPDLEVRDRRVMRKDENTSRD
jgi:hypothetical protein